MIASLRGIIAELNGNMAIVEVAGVGYGVTVTVADQEDLRVGSTAKLNIYENIKEDSHDLYGFLLNDTKNLFVQLISVKNVGPKVALSVLDIGTTDAVRLAISDGDVRLLKTAKGVGKRAADQIVVELRDKVGTPVGDGAEGIISRSGINETDEALQALTSLGYTESDAQLALQNIDLSLTTEERIKLALRGGR